MTCGLCGEPDMLEGREDNKKVYTCEKCGLQIIVIYEPT